MEMIPYRPDGPAHMARVARVTLSLLTACALLLSACAKLNPFQQPPDYPVIDSISPATGRTGTEVRLYGTGFANFFSGDTVRFNGALVEVDPLSNSTVILATVVSNTGTGPVSVKVNGQTATGPIFTYDQNAISLNSLSPPSGWVDTLVTLRGVGFGASPDSVTVNFNGTPASIQRLSDTLILVRAPNANNGLPGQVTVTVSRSGRTSNGLPFLYSQTFVNNPLITNVNAPSRQPFQFAAGDTVTITGNYFGTPGGGSQVQIDSNNAPFSPNPTVLSWTNTQIVVIMPTYNDPDSTLLQLSVVQGTHVGSANVLYRVPGGGSGVFSASTFSVARDRLAAAGIGTKIVFAGGYNNFYNGDINSNTFLNTVDIYDINARTWNTAQLSAARADLAGAAAGNKIVFAGGQNATSLSNVVDIYDANAGTWTTAQLSTARWDLVGAGTGSKILFAGGIYNGANISNTVDIYDVNTGTWTTAQLSLARFNLAAAAAGSKILFAGGTTGTFYTNVVDIYDVNTGTWTTAQLSEARKTPSAAAAGNKIFIVGGTNDSQAASATVDIYDVTTGIWTTAQLSQARYSIAAAGSGTKVIFAGGANGSIGDNLATIDIYDIATGTWSVATLSEGRADIAGAATGNTFLFAGGDGIGPGQSNTVDIIRF